MKTKFIKKMFVVILAFVLLVTIPNCVKAASLSDIWDGADDFMHSGGIGLQNTINDSKLESMSDILYNILLAVAIVVAVIMGLFIGIRFITGSVDQKAKIKETLIIYIVGCVVAFGAFGIWKLVIEVMSQA